MSTFLLWILRTKGYGIKNNGYEPIDLERLTNKREINTNKLENSIVWVGNNLTPLRLHIAFKCLKIVVLEWIYMALQSRPIESKSSVLKNYWYSLCLENSYHPGYVTEKIFDGYQSGTIPIYWGGIDDKLIDTSAIISLESTEIAEDLINKLTIGQDKIKEKFNKSLFKSKMGVEDFIGSIQRSISKQILGLFT